MAVDEAATGKERKAAAMSCARARRRVGALPAVIGALALSGGLAAPAQASGLTPEGLAAAGWECFQTPPFINPPRIVCANPGLGRPLPGNPDPPRAYTLPQFDLAGNFLGMEHLIRADLYQGQPCAPFADAYVFRMPIDYYACLRI